MELCVSWRFSGSSTLSIAGRCNVPAWSGPASLHSRRDKIISLNFETSRPAVHCDTLMFIRIDLASFVPFQRSEICDHQLATWVCLSSNVYNVTVKRSSVSNFGIIVLNLFESLSLIAGHPSCSEKVSAEIQRLSASRKEKQLDH